MAGLLSLVLALTSVTLAVARHAPIGVTTLALCSDAGPQMVTLDAQGKPVPMSHPCPDCVAAMAAQAVPAATDVPMLQRVARGHLVAAPPAVITGQRAVAPTARGPPVWMM